MRIINTLVFFLFSVAAYGQEQHDMEWLFQNGAFEKVIENGTKILETNQHDLTVSHLVGRSLAALKRFEAAKPFLEKTTIKSAPGWMKAWSFAYLGICNYATGDIKESKRNLKKAIELNATKKATKFAQKNLKLLTLNENSRDWEVVETEHIKFHIQANHQIGDIQAYCQMREEAFKANNVFFNASLYKKIDFYVWTDLAKGKKVLGQEIGFANADLCVIHSKVDQTTGHEITHILCDFGIKPGKKNRLINEGVAVAFDLTQRNRLELAKSMNSNNLSVKMLMQDSFKYPEQVVYSIGGALIEYLMERKDRALVKKVLKEQSYDVLLETYGLEIIAEFDQKIKN